MIIFKKLAFNVIASWINSFRLRSYKYLSRSWDIENVVHWSDDFVEEERGMTECPKQFVRKPQHQSPPLKRDQPLQIKKLQSLFCNLLKVRIHCKMIHPREDISWLPVPENICWYLTAPGLHICSRSSSFKEVVGGPRFSFWMPGIQLDLKTQKENWTLMLDLQSDENNLLISKWMFQMNEGKGDSGNIFEKRKAHLRERGFRHVYGIDFGWSYVSMD